MAMKRGIFGFFGRNRQFNHQREEIMKKFTVLTAFVFLFGIGSATMAADIVNYNDVVTADGAAANDGGLAVAVNDAGNQNQLGSNNKATFGSESTTTINDTRNDPKNSYNLDESKNNSTNTAGLSLSGFGSAANVGEGSAEVNAEYHAKHEVYNVSNAAKTNSDNWKINSDQVNSNNKYEVEVEDGDGNAVTMEGKASVDSRDQSTETDVSADADDDSIAAVNTQGNILLDQSTTIDISNIGLAIQKNELSGDVSHNQLHIGGPHAKSETKAGDTKTGEAKTGEAKTGEAKSGNTESGALSGSGSGAGAFAAGNASADASSESSSDSNSSATGGAANGGSATSGSATSGPATGGTAQGAAALATVSFTTGDNSFTTGTFNGIATFNVNSGVNSLQQSPISINAVVGSGVAAQ